MKEQDLKENAVGESGSAPSPADPARSATRRKVAGFALAAVVLFLVGLAVGRKSMAPSAPAAGAEPEKKDDDDATPKVRIQAIRRSTVSPRLVCFGFAKSRPGTEAAISARVAAIVSEVCARTGDHVEAGQTIVRLDSRALAQAREKAQGALAEVEAELQKGRRGLLEIEIAGLRVGLAQAKADTLQADRSLTRQEELSKSGLVSDKQLQEAQASAEIARLKMAAATQQLERAEGGLQAEERSRLEARVAQARADLEGAQLQESFADVRAPMAGVVSELDVVAGQSVDVSTVLARVVSASTIDAVLTVPAERAGEIVVGADVRLLAGANEVARAKVTGVAAGATVDGTVKLTAAAVDERLVKNVLPGTPLGAEIAVGSITALTVPKESVVQDHERTVVVLVEEKQVPDEKDPKKMVVKKLAKKVPVKVLCRDGGVVAIEGPESIVLDAPVVIEGAYNLPDGAEVDADE